jgi:hypothetical protein
MILRPGSNQPSTLNLVEVARVNSKRRISVLLTTNEEEPIDINETIYPDGSNEGELDLEIIDIADNVIFSSQYFPHSNPRDTRITKISTGKYAVTLTQEETQYSGTLLANWHVRKDAAAEDIYKVQVVEIVSPQVLAILPQLRLLLDKSLKVVFPDENCFLGYTDSMLIMFLQMGLSKINAAQPYPTFTVLDAYPLNRFSETLLRCALYEALTSQFLFAVDTDVPSFSDSGHSFIIDHRTLLLNYVNSLGAQLDKDIQKMKMHLINSGTVSAEYKYGNYYYALLSSSPYGSILRGGIPNTTA